MSDNESRRRSAEARERRLEAREPSEERSEELKKAAAMERADYLGKEIQSSQKQMRNIFLHIQQVTAAIRQLRAQLSLAGQSTDPASVARDKEIIEALRRQIAGYQHDLLNMKDDLVREQMDELRKQGGTDDKALRQQAQTMVGKMLEDFVLYLSA